MIKFQRFTVLDFVVLVSVIVTFAINQIQSPSGFATLYTNGIYSGIRKIYDVTLKYIPFAISYLVLPFLFTMLVLAIIRCVKFLKQKEFVLSLRPIFYFFGAIYVGFYIFWGFNYKATNLVARMHLTPVSIDTNLIEKELYWTLSELQKLRTSISNDTLALSLSHRPNDLNELITEEEKKFLSQAGYPTNFDIKIRALEPKGSLLCFSTAGIYNPFSFEGHYDNGLSHVHSTFVIAHEMAHGYGITDEGECNFVALITCLNVDNKYINYTGLLTYYRYLASDLKDAAPTTYQTIKASMPSGVRNDLKHLYAALDRYPDILPNLRDFIYDSYLKSNGVSAGIASYDKVVNMAFGYKKMYGLDYLKTF